MRNRQYNDAIKILVDTVKEKSESEGARDNLMLGECYYLIGKYNDALPCFTKAARNCTSDKDKATAEFRLACTAYYRKDFQDASARITAFSTQFPADARIGKLKVYKMAILSPKGKTAQEDIESLHRSIHDDLKKNGYAVGMEADGLLTDFYRANGLPDKAQALLSQTVHNFRNVIAEYQRDKQPIPAGMEKYHDNSALQLGLLCTERKDYAAAMTWLENVRYDAESKMKAKLLLAKICYEKQEFNKAQTYLSDPAFLDTVPESALKSDMYLLLGICEKNKPGANAARVEEFLKKVASGTKGYPQAQLALGDVYREKGVTAEAVKAYTRVMEISEYAAAALYNLGLIYMDESARAASPEVGAPSLKLASASFGQLLAKYPLSPEVKKAKEKIDELGKKGIAVTAADNGDATVVWRKTAENQKGAAEGAQALMSLARHFMRDVFDDKTKKVVLAPNYKESTAACDALLDAATYSGKGLSEDAWKSLRSEALYTRGICELASASPPEKSAGAAPVYLEKASVEKAAAFFESAKALADPKKPEPLRSIELALVEAKFKSSRREDKEFAEKRFGELEADLGNDSRFQKLALELAEWYRANNRYAEAAKQYAAIAERGHDLSSEDIMKALYQSGNLYSKAAFEAQKTQGEAAYGIYIFPKETLNLGGGVLRTHEPLQRPVKIVWPHPNMTPREALVALSKASGVPFVWSRENGKELGHYMENKHITLKDGEGTPAEFLAKILELDHHRLDFDLGFTGSVPTLQLKSQQDDPNERPAKVIEINDDKFAHLRFPPLARSYGAWHQVHERSKKSNAGVMLHSVLSRIEEISQTKISWAEGIEKETKLATEFRDSPANGGSDVCARVLAAALAAKDLSYRIVRRDMSAELYEKAKDSFNKIRKIDPKSHYGERSLFALALNYFNQQDYGKMKIILREYLKVFDNSNNEYYHPACYYLGWLFEREKNYREACGYYARAAEERLVFYKRAENEPFDKDTIRKQISFDAVFPLSEPLNGELKDRRLADFGNFITLNTHVDVRIDSSAQTLDFVINKPAFKKVNAFELMLELLGPNNVGVRGENVNKEAAEKAYFRLAAVYEKDNLMEQALDNINALLARYPETKYKKDACAVKLGIYKGLKDYAQVLATLDELKKISGKDVDPYKFELEMAAIYFDMCDYAKASAAFKNAIGSVKDSAERADVQEQLARALMRGGKLDEALAQYVELSKDETSQIGKQVSKLMVFYLNFALGKSEAREFPDAYKRFIFDYEKLDDAARKNLSKKDLALVTWIYFVQGLMNEKNGAPDIALASFNAAANSPDEALAGEAGFRAGQLYVTLKNFDKAKESFEYVLFSTKSNEAAVKSTFMLGQCFDKLDKPDKALERYKQIIQRYPLSPYVESVKQTEIYKSSERATAPKTQDLVK
ncbi:MAG: tetratricopeptide repeat protein [Planctomycetota bacterium]